MWSSKSYITEFYLIQLNVFRTTRPSLRVYVILFGHNHIYVPEFLYSVFRINFCMNISSRYASYIYHNLYRISFYHPNTFWQLWTFSSWSLLCSLFTCQRDPIFPSRLHSQRAFIQITTSCVMTVVSIGKYVATEASKKCAAFIYRVKPSFGLVDPEDGEGEILQNLVNYLPAGVSQHSERYEPWVTSPWEPQISHIWSKFHMNIRVKCFQ